LTFLNFAMLAGLAGVAIPIVIHLLNRRKATVVQWGAMRFLEEAMASQNRRIRIEEIILLALRCFLLALLALALARPFVPSRSVVSWALVVPTVLIASVLAAVAGGMWSDRKVRNRLLAVAAGLVLLAGALSILENVLQHRLWGSGAGQKDVALVIDGSTSMTLDVDGKRNFDRAVAEARAVVASANPSDAFSVILAGQAPRPIIATPTNDREEIYAALDDLEPMGGAMQAVDAIAQAAASLSSGSNAGKKVVLISDGQSTGWQLGDRDPWEFVGRRLRATGPGGGELPTAPELVCRSLPTPTSWNNLAAADVSLGRDVIGTDRTVSITVRVANTGTSPMTPEGVELHIDNAEILTADVKEIPAGAVEVAEFEYRFPEPGRHVLTARVLGADDLPADNEARRVAEVKSRLGVLVIDGSVTPDRSGPARAVTQALAPDANDPTAPDQLADIEYLVDPEVFPVADVEQIGELSGYAAVVLANVPMLPDDFAERLADYVQRGGGLMVLAGHWAEPEFYNAWSTEEGLAVLPCRLPEERWIDADHPARLAVPTFAHPSLSELTPERSGDVVVRAHWPIQPDPQDRNVRVAGRLDEGTPLLVERTLGKGRVLMSPFSPQQQDTNLPSKACFVYLMHESIYYLASPGASQPNYRPGERVAFPLGRAATPGEAIGTGLRGEYFRSDDWKKRQYARTDPTIHFEWREGSPKGIPKNYFTVRWTGWLVPPRSGKYTFHVNVDDALKIWIDDDVVFHQPDYTGSEDEFTIRLRRGRRYAFRADFREDKGGAHCRLEWSHRSISRRPISRTHLFPPMSEDNETRKLLASWAESEQTIPVESPAGEPLEARVIRRDEDNTYLLALDRVDRPGVYYVSPPPELGNLLPPSSDPNGRVPLAVTAEAGESELTRFEPAEMRPVADSLDKSNVKLLLAGSTDELTAAVSGDVPGEEWWKYLAVGVLVVLVAEIALTRWIATNRRTASVTEIDFEGELARLRTFRARAKEMLDEGPAEREEVTAE
jgi:hypothetical protein